MLIGCQGSMICITRKGFNMYGWMGTILHIDLSSGKIEKKPLSDRLRLNYLGSRGINSRILYDTVGPEVDALSPENRLIFGNGPVVVEDLKR